MTVQELMQINNIQDPKALQIGQVLYLKKAANTNAVSQVETPVSSVQAEQQPEVTVTETTSVSPSSSVVEEDNFEDLFEEGSDIPVVPLEDIK
jgi:hypothetical protein